MQATLEAEPGFAVSTWQLSLPKLGDSMVVALEPQIWKVFVEGALQTAGTQVVESEPPHAAALAANATNAI